MFQKEAVPKGCAGHFLHSQHEVRRTTPFALINEMYIGEHVEHTIIHSRRLIPIQLRV